MSRAHLALDLLRSGYKVRFRVMGTSMLPAIAPGSTVIVEPVDARSLEQGDIVLSNGAGRLIAHRIESVHADRRGVLKFVLRGDNLPHCDLPVTAGAILGRVRCVAANDNGLETRSAFALHAERITGGPVRLARARLRTACWTLVDRLGREARRALGGAS